jgi:hypothetical protein
MMKLKKCVAMIPAILIFLNSLSFAAIPGDANENGKLDLADAIIILQTLAGLRPAADISGYWQSYFTPQGQATSTSPEYLQLSQSGDTVTLLGPCKISTGYVPIGTMNGPNFTIVISGANINISGTVNDNTISGTYSDNKGNGTWTAIKMSHAPSDKQCVISTLDAFCVYFPNNSQYYVESTFTDLNAIVSSATITGSNIVNPVSYSYNLYQNKPNQWWTNPNIYISTGTVPSFPLSYSINFNFKDGTSQTISKSMTTWETAQ